VVAGVLAGADGDRAADLGHRGAGFARDPDVVAVQLDGHGARGEQHRPTSRQGAGQSHQLRGVAGSAHAAARALARWRRNPLAVT